MFKSAYVFKGDDASKIINLTEGINGAESSVKAYVSNYRLMIDSALVGFLYGKKKEESEGGSEKKIQDQTIIENGEEFKYVYRLIMLSDEENEPDPDKRIDKAFKIIGTDSEEARNDEKLFKQYVCGGLEIIYEKLIKEALEEEDFLENLSGFVEEIDVQYNESVDRDAVLRICSSIKVG